MTTSRGSSPAPGAATRNGGSRMLRIEYKGQPYDWFNLDEMGDVVRDRGFSNTLKENITHYFGVPFEFQAVYDEEGLLSSVVDYARALRSTRPWLRVYDVREMLPALKDKTAQQLEDVHADVMRSKQNFCGGNAIGSPPRLANSMADVVRNANESGITLGSSYSMEAASRLPNPRVNGTSARFATPPPLRTSGIPGVVPSATGIPGVVASQNGVSTWASPVAITPSTWAAPVATTSSPSQVWRSQSMPQMQTSLGGAISSYKPIAPQSVPMMPSVNLLGSNTLLPYQASPATPPKQPSPRQASPARQERSSLSPRQLLPEVEMVEVSLTKEPPFERFGFANVPSRDGRALLVSWVDPTGLLEIKWNREHQDQRIIEGNRIVAVNNQTNLEDMRQQLQSKSVRLRIQQQTPEL